MSSPRHGPREDEDVEDFFFLEDALTHAENVTHDASLARAKVQASPTENEFVFQFHQIVDEVVPVSWFGASKRMNLS